MTAAVIDVATTPHVRSLRSRLAGAVAALGALAGMAATATVLCGLGGALLLTVLEFAAGWRLPYTGCCAVVFIAVVWAAGEWSRRRTD